MATMIDAMTLLVIERYELMIALCIDAPCPRAALNEGQNENKNIVPTIDTRSER